MDWANLARASGGRKTSRPARCPQDEPEMDQVAMAIDRPIDRHLHHQLRTCAHGRDETTRSGTEESKAFAWPLTRSPIA
ncbi:hypothetical protein [Oryza sativa Japonica Group]|uniref:Uncharacterized protein n=1 Tax=Oryza sativa subsp. japonica TaxID=39947 RepID=Q5N8X5_ORYSJ|nr:hypothetical protein [Oryza sativa Japonica Group]